ncbi:MAG: CocE/NonD family hydrolase [Actinomycetota bacterium]
MRKIVLLALAVVLLPLASPSGQAATASQLQYVNVPNADGSQTSIAVSVWTPTNYVPSHNYPTLVEVEGYGGAYSPNDQTFISAINPSYNGPFKVTEDDRTSHVVTDPNYVVVGVSLRGTGCSGGQLDLFSQQSSKDVAWIIDNWIPNQAWSNGDVGIYGHSYSGLTGFLVAEQHPTHLRAVTVSGLIDDFYRGILYPGGIPNPGFPLLWGAILRPESENSSDYPAVMNDPTCQANYLQHQASDLAPPVNLLLPIYGQPQATDTSWAITHRLLNDASQINVPIQLGSQAQDEQTGPRGAYQLFQHLDNAPLKRLVLSTGRHNPNDPTGTKVDWMDCILRSVAITSNGRSCSDVLDPSKRVLFHFESQGSYRNNPYVTSDWPAPETRWSRYYLNGDGTLQPTPVNGSTVYVSTGTGRELAGDLGDPTGLHQGPFLAPLGYTKGLPDTARFESGEFGPSGGIVAGPADVTLYAKATSTDFDVFTEVLDQAPDGTQTFVESGMLRASFRATIDAASDKTPSGDIYRPYHPFTNPANVIPGQISKYEIEVFPFEHVFRPGHKMVLQVHAPPANYPNSTWAFEPNLPSVVTIVQDASHPSSILLPMLPTTVSGMIASSQLQDATPACGAVIGEVCVTPAAG